MSSEKQTRAAKRAARSAARDRIASMSAADRRDADRAICTRLTSLPEWVAAGRVLAYHAFGEETSVGGAIDAALRTGKELYLPRVAETELSFRRMFDEASLRGLVAHRFGMLEPPGSAPELVFADRPTVGETDAWGTLVVCPGRAYDVGGNRLGHGAGFYDRFLTMLDGSPIAATVVAVGVCYDVQLVDTIPVTASDHRVDLVVTETRTLRFGDRPTRGASF